MGIKKVLLCGLGAVGLTYANKLKDVCELKILADQTRSNKYINTPPELNNKKILLEYIEPDDSWNPDLIIITTKFQGLEDAINYIKNFVNENTIIISLINGISSENKIAEVYGRDKVIHSYFIGHSAVRQGNKVFQDGIGTIVFGSPYSENHDNVCKLRDFFQKNQIDYKVPSDIIYALWLKFTLNIFSNQASAIMNLSFGDMKHSNNFINFAKNVIAEVAEIAKKENVSSSNLEKDAIDALMCMVDDGKTSMLQDILAGRTTEVDIFSGEIIKLGKKYGVKTPYNKIMYEMVKIKEEISCS